MIAVQLPPVTLSTEQDISHFQDIVKRNLDHFTWRGKDIFAILQALQEALVNAFKHGNQGDPNKTIKVEYQVSQYEVLFQITDEGQGFKLEDVPDPCIPENLERPCGRGLLMMRHYMTEVTYNNKGNQVTMIKKRNA